MRDVSLAWPHIISASHRIRCQVTSHRAGRLLADRVPVLAGTLTYDDTARLRRRVSLTVAADTLDGRHWLPGDNPDHPLAAFGQRLNIHAGVEHPTGYLELPSQGWYLITGWDLDEGSRTLTVTADDLAVLIDDARHYTVETPPEGATYASEFTRLVDGILPVFIHPDLPARKVNANTVWDRERTRNLDRLCKAWGARWIVDDHGRAAALPAYESVETQRPVKRLTAGSTGTVIERSRTAERSRLFNAVVATGKAPDPVTARALALADEEPVPWAVAEITDPRHPLRVDGPWGRRPRFYSSDMLTSDAECAQAAHDLLLTATLTARTEPLTVLPDPALELGDVVTVATGGGEFTGRIASLTLPLTTDGMTGMTVTLTNTAGDDEDGQAAVLAGKQTR